MLRAVFSEFCIPAANMPARRFALAGGRERQELNCNSFDFHFRHCLTFPYSWFEIVSISYLVQSIPPLISFAKPNKFRQSRNEDSYPAGCGAPTHVVLLATVVSHCTMVWVRDQSYCCLKVKRNSELISNLPGFSPQRHTHLLQLIRSYFIEIFSEHVILKTCPFFPTL